MAQDSKARMIRSAAGLISTRGVNATSFRDVLADSGAPRGSIYHHFPEGKAQLAEDAVRWTAGLVIAHQRERGGETASSALECFIRMWRRVVLDSSATAGCVVAGVTVDAGGEEGVLLPVAREMFADWVDLMAGQFAGGGVPAARARPLALTALAAMEGALILCRAEGGVAPLDAVADELRGLISAASR